MQNLTSSQKNKKSCHQSKLLSMTTGYHFKGPIALRHHISMALPFTHTYYMAFFTSCQLKIFVLL